MNACGASLKISAKQNAAVYLLYLAISGVFFYQIWQGKIYIDLGDGWCQFYSRLVYFSGCMRQGIFPFWNPLVLCGIPEGLDVYSNFSFSHLLSCFIPVDQVWNVLALANSSISAWLTYLFLKKEARLSDAAAFFGGFVYLTLNPSYFLTPKLFVPLIFLFSAKWTKKRDIFSLFLLSLSVTLYYLNSNPQYVIYVSLLSFAYILTVLIKRSDARDHTFLTSLFYAGLPFAFAGCLGAFQILRQYEYLKNCHRYLAVSNILQVLPVTNLVQFLDPHFFSSFFDQGLEHVPAVIKNIVNSILCRSCDMGFLPAPYIGVIPFLLCCLGLSKKNKSLLQRFLLTASIFSIGYLLFNPLIYPLIKNLPILKGFCYVNRLSIVFEFGAAVLAAISFDGLLRSEHRKEPAKADPVIKIMTRLALALIVFKLLAWVLFFAFSGPLGEVVKKQYFIHKAGHQNYRAGDEFYLKRIEEIMRYMKSWSSFNNLYFPASLSLLVSSLFLLKRRIEGRLKTSFFVFFIFALFFADAFINLRDPEAHFPIELRKMDAEAAFLRQQNGLFRVMPLQRAADPTHPGSMSTASTVLRPETNLIYGLPTIEGYRSLMPYRYSQFIPLVTGKAVSVWLSGEYSQIDHDWADRLNIRYLITDAKLDLGNGYRLVYTGDSHRIYENPTYWNRAFLLHRAYMVSTADEALKRLKDKRINFSSDVLLEERDKQGQSEERGQAKEGESVKIIDYKPNEVRVELLDADNGFLVLSDSFLPGWKVFVDGQPRPLLAADYYFRAVRVNRGDHDVRFLYDPPSFKLGLVISLISLSIVALIVFGQVIPKRK